MPTFVLDTDQHISATVDAFYPFEKRVRGDVVLRWFAKKVDYTTPLYNDSVLYRQEVEFDQQTANTYRTRLYDTIDGIPQRNLSFISRPERYNYDDPYTV